jgi:hypothetical protein
MLCPFATICLKFDRFNVFKMFFSSFLTVFLSFLLRLKIIYAEIEGKLLKEIHKICWEGVVESAVLEF